jgi:hypothetical protein
MPNTYTELLKTTVGTATSSFIFDLTGISGYTDLVLISSVQKTASGSGNGFNIRFNGDAGTNYSNTFLEGSGSSASSYRSSNSVGLLAGAMTSNANSSQFDVNINNIMNYANSSTYKTVISRYNDNEFSYVGAVVSLWRSTAAITSITLYSASSFAVGSTFSLYGIANADQGAAKATGGIITEDANYWYHTFGASSAFIPKQSLTCDVLVVAGGGGAGYYYGGGGGAGGIQYATSQSLTATTYNVTIGSGGPTKLVGTAGAGTVGVDSSFSSLVIAKGGGFGNGAVSGSTAGGNGGSGGGAGGPSAGSSGGTATAGTGGTFYGNNGGPTPGGGSGGGSGAAGASVAKGGNGTTAFSSWGLATGTGQNVSGVVYYAGGGESNGSYGGGGLGGGGAWLTSGTANTGGGAGADQGAGAGGSGIVIVRYAK